MSLTKTLKNRGLKLLFCGALALTLLGGVKLGIDTSAAHAAPAQHLLACGGGGADALPPCQ